MIRYALCCVYGICACVCEMMRERPTEEGREEGWGAKKGAEGKGACRQRAPPTPHQLYLCECV